MKDLVVNKRSSVCVLKIHKVFLYTAYIKCMTVHFGHVWSFKWSKYYSSYVLHLMCMALYETGMVNSCFMG